jgi:hypothetical protein
MSGAQRERLHEELRQQRSLARARAIAACFRCALRRLRTLAGRVAAIWQRRRRR